MKNLMEIVNWKLKIRKLPRYLRKISIMLLIFITVLTSGSMIYLFGPFAKEAKAAWFDENWGYREAIPATSTEGAAQTNVFLSFTLDTATPIAAGKLQSSCQDIRITDVNGKLLKYHVGRVTACNNAATTIDFLLASFPDGQSTYYVYYGNSLAPSADAGTLTVSAASTSTVTASGNEITDAVRTTNTQGDGVTPPDSSYGIWQAATNLNTNGGFESNATGWLYYNGGGGTGSIARDNTHAKFGSWALKVVTGGELVNQGPYINGTFAGGNRALATTGQTFSVSSWIYASAGDRYFIGFDEFNSSDAYLTSHASSQVTAVAGWNYLTYTGTTSQATVAYIRMVIRTSVTAPAQAITFWVDGAQLETGSIATPYIETDGGTASRSAARVQASSSVLNATQGWAAFYLKLDNASTAVNQPIVFTTRGDVNNYIEIGYYQPGGVWYINRTGSGTTNEKDVSDTWAAGATRVLVAKWTATGLTLSVGGAAFPSPVAQSVIPALPATFDLGSKGGASNWIDSRIGWFTAGTGTLANADASTLNGYGNTDPTTVQLAALNGGIANSTFLWTAATTAETQTSFSQNSARNYTIGSLATEEKGPGPIAYWSFDEGNGTSAHDSTSNSNTGTLGGATIPTWQTEDQCISGKCLYFDGATSKVTGSKVAKNIQTISFWVRPNTIASQGLLNLDGGTHKINTNASGVISASGFTSPTYYINGKATATPTLIQNQWNFVSVTTATGFDSTSSFTVGTDGTNFIKGFIDEPKFYNYARSSSQVQADYNSRGSSSAGGNVLGIKDQSYLSSGLVDYYKMDEASWNGTSGEVIDSSGNGNNGTATGSVDKPTTATGYFGNGGSFDGTDDYVSAAASSSLDPTSSITLSAWINTNVNNTVKSIISDRSGGNSNWQLFIDTPGTIRIIVYVNNNTTVCDVSGSTTISTGTWHHVAGVYNGSSCYIYLDGNLDGSGPGSGSISTTSTAVTIGIDSVPTGPSTRYFNGAMDEVRIYNRSLSPNEISQLYNFAPGPTAQWNFDEGQGTTVNDTSGNGYTGTITGATYTTGKYGKGLSFSGGTNTVSSIPSISGIQTVGFWVNPTSTTANMLDINTSGPAYISASSGTISATGFSTPVIYVNGVVSSTLTANTWQYVTVTTATALTGSAIQIGRANGTSLNGKMDDVKIYNYARTAKQITEDMNAGHPNVGSPVGSPVGYWKFDEGYGITANNSGNGGAALNGTINNMSSPATATSGWTNNGKIGKALNFDGSNDTNRNYISISESPTSPLNITGDVTISAWIKPISGYLDTVNQQVVRSGAGSDEVYHFMYDPATQRVQFGWYDGSFHQNYSTTNAVPLNQWSHVVMVRSGLTSTIYVNGIFNATAAVTTPTVLASEFDIGGSNSGAVHQNFHGTIDEVKIYNYGLTTGEVALDYNHNASQVLGATSTASNGITADNSASRAFCVPGDTSSCANPVGQWNFDENQGSSVNDITGNNNLGSWHGTTAWTQGKYGSAANFTASSQYVDVGNSSTLSPSSTITVEAWVYPTSLPNTDHAVVSRFYTAPSDATSSWILEALNSGGNKWRLLILQSDLTTHAISGGTVTLNAWNHVVGVADGSNLRLYVNGVSVATPVAYDGTINTSSRDTLIGRTRTDDTYGNFFGKIDQVNIFNYARSAAQVAWDFNRGGPVGWWKLDECQGTTANDASGKGNTGTLTVGALVAGTCTDGTGTTIWNKGSSGKYNSSFYGDGTNDYTSVPDTSTLSFTNNVFSISFWIKANTTNVGMGIFNKNGTSGSNWEYGTDADNGLPGFQFVARSLGGSNVYAQNSQPFSTSWVHYVWTADGTNGRVYKNGVLVNTTAKTANNMGNGIGALEIGRGRSGNYFNGQVDDFKVFNYALTPTQIRTLYNSGAAFFGPVTGTP